MDGIAGGLDATLTLLFLGGLVAAAAVGTAALVAPQRGGARALTLLLVAGAVALVTLLPTGYAHASVNLDPGAGLAAPWRSPVSAVNILGNLLLFVPVGVALPALLRGLRRVHRLVPAAAGLSLLIELTQYAYVPGRAADVNDVLLNTAGALAGLVAYRAVRARELSRTHPSRA